MELIEEFVDVSVIWFELVGLHGTVSDPLEVEHFFLGTLIDQGATDFHANVQIVRELVEHRELLSLSDHEIETVLASAACPAGSMHEAVHVAAAQVNDGVNVVDVQAS